MNKRKNTKQGGVAALSGLEQEVMNVVWDLGECNSTQVIQAFRDVRPLADTTIRTVLANLRKKGYLELVPTTDVGLRIRPVVSRQAVARSTLKQLVARLFGGSRTMAVSFLLKDEELTKEELEAIRKLVNEQQ